VRIHHIALQAADCEGTARFYREVLGLAEVRRQVEGGKLRSVWLAAGEAMLMIETSLRGRPDAAGSRHLLCFAVDDLPSWEARLRAAGVAVEDRTGSTLYVSDPEGHRVGLSVYRF
jgi:catechol 2,3-dioxygenase-like lactoylglutathione lyase family enzyme